MEFCFKLSKNIILYSSFLLAILISGCNKESLIEGALPAKATIVTLDKSVNSNNSINLSLQLNGQALAIPIIFNKTLVSGSTFKYELYANNATAIRWAMDTYIRKMNVGESITNNIFIAGGTNYFISALVNNAGYNYTYAYSFKVNEINYAAFKYTTILAGKTIIFYGWISFTATDTKVTFHKYGYAQDDVITVGE